MNCTKKGVMNILGGEDSISLLTLYSALQVNLQLKVLVKTVHPFLNKQCIFSYKCETLFCLFIYHFFLLNEITYYKIVKRIKTKQNQTTFSPRLALQHVPMTKSTWIQ